LARTPLGLPKPPYTSVSNLFPSKKITTPNTPPAYFWFSGRREL
jgi:hypothetical protein